VTLEVNRPTFIRRQLQQLQYSVQVYNK